MTISNRKKQLRDQVKKMNLKNPKKKVTRSGLQRSSKKRSPKPKRSQKQVDDKPQPRPSPAAVAALQAKRARSRFIKLKQKYTLQQANLFRAKNKASADEPTTSSSTNPSYSPRSALRVIREIGIGQKGIQKLRNRALSESKSPLFPSIRKLYLTQKELERGFSYIVDENEVVRLESISDAVQMRLNNLNIANRTALLSVDKGQGRVLVGLAFPFRHEKNAKSHPCSDTNQLVLASWEGSDKYDALSERIKSIYEELRDLGINVLLGGDLAFLCANFGCHSAMSKPCPWCNHTFDKSESRDKDSIPFLPVYFKIKRNTVRRAPIWNVDLRNVVPPVLHMKLKIGNDLLQRLKDIAENDQKREKLNQILAKIGLNKDRKSERKIYAELNGGDIKKFSRSWEKFSGLSDSNEYSVVLKILEAFDKWSSLASNAALSLSNDHLRQFCCPEIHADDDCCTTARLVKCLERVGGFGGSVKIHVLAQHTGQFAWNHQFLGAVAEEGIEKLHRTIKDDLQRVSRKDQIEKLKICLKRWSTQALLSDSCK